MTRFQHCLKIVLKHEGGYVNHPNDRGGATNYGVIQRNYDEYRTLLGKEPRSVKLIDPEELEAIYMGYWKSSRADRLPQPLDLLVFDFAVNSGARRAITYLQRALGIGDDGIWGPQTAKALDEEMEAGQLESLCSIYLDLRRSFYDRIIQRDPSQAVFAKGWMRRVDSLETELA